MAIKVHNRATFGENKIGENSIILFGWSGYKGLYL